MAGNSPGWPQEHADMLRDCLAANMSHGQAARLINSRFHMNYTRCSAIGKAHRMGWKSAKQPGADKSIKTRASKKRLPRPTPLSASIPQTEEIVMHCSEVVPLNLSLVDLPSDGCKWPSGGWSSMTTREAITFCGHTKPAGDEVPYCAAHTRLSVDLVKTRLGRAHRKVHA